MESTEEFESNFNALHRLSIALEEIRDKVPLPLKGIPVLRQYLMLIDLVLLLQTTCFLVWLRMLSIAHCGTYQCK